MVIDYTSKIMPLLLSNKVITDWTFKLNGKVPNISANKTPSGQLPAIVLYESLNRDGEFADDRPYTSRLKYQISLFSENGGFSTVPDEIDDLMRTLGFTRDNLFTQFDKDTKIYQKIMLYSAEPSFDTI